MHEVGDLVYFIGLPEKTLGLVKEVSLRAAPGMNGGLYWYLVDWIIYDGFAAASVPYREHPKTPERFYEDELKKAQVDK